MLRARYRIPGLIIIFLISFILWFRLSPGGDAENAGITYTVLETAAMPLLRADTCGRSMNLMCGHLDSTEADVAADALILLPEDRKLTMTAEDNHLTVTGIRYEIRTTDLSNLIERTELPQEVRRDASFSFELPIQNLIRSGQEYRLDVILSTAEKGEISYCSRIAFDETGLGTDMAALAEDFSKRNFDYDDARENTTYLETNETGDNTTLGLVNLKSNYNQLTYGKLDLVPSENADLRFLEYTGSVGVLERKLTASGTDGKDRVLYEISEYFVMRKGPERLYMMDYQRSMHEIFSGSRERFHEGKAILGISEDSAVQAVTSPNGEYSAFVSAGDVWVADGDRKRCVKAWSMRSSSGTTLRDNITKNGAMIFSCGDDGTVQFAVYGYMNRGSREGQSGVSLMSYSSADNTVTEKIYIPCAETFEELEEDIGELCYQGSNGMLYLKLGRIFSGINILSGEYIVISDIISEGNYAVSASGSRIAWQDRDDVFGAPVIHFMNLDSGTKKEINSGEGQILKPLGFIDRDLVIGIATEDNVWNLNGVDRELPFSAIEIVNDALDSQAHYEESGAFITDVQADESRIHLTKVVKTGEHSFRASGTDTIVCNVKAEELPEVASDTSELREKYYYAELPKGVSEKNPRVTAPMSVSFDQSPALDLAGTAGSRRGYAVYGGGRYLGCVSGSGAALRRAYEHMGLVRLGGRMVYCRAATASIRTLRSVESAAETLMTAREAGTASDYYGAPMRAVLYYVTKGTPVLGWTEDGIPAVIYAYDQAAVSLYLPYTGEWLKLPLADAEELFRLGRNDFCCVQP